MTRADGSGTYVKEQELWGAAGVEPEGEDWYSETGLGMGPTLQVSTNVTTRPSSPARAVRPLR